MAGSRSGSPVKAASPKKRPASPKKRVKKPKKPSAHPPVADMVVAAIKALNDRKGTSGVAIKKYIAANYKVDMVRMAPFIRKSLKTGVTSGRLVQKSGTGAAGRFRLGKTAPKKKAKKPKKKAKKPKKKKAKKPKAKKVKKPKAKKAKKAKKATKAKKPKAKKAKKVVRKAKPKAAKKAAKPKAAKKAAKK